MRRYRGFVWFTLMLLAGLLVNPGLAQDPRPPLFATNTPPAPLAVISTPSVPINRFVLRPWQAGDLVEVLYTRVRQLTPGAIEMENAIALTQYELTRRFPRALQDAKVRQRLLPAMLAAPIGSIDLRSVARPFIEALVNQQAAAPLIPFEDAGFQVDVLPANLDGIAPEDAVLHVYAADAAGSPVYDDYVPVIGSASGPYRVLDSPDLPASPLDSVAALELMGVGDFNRDGLDELAIALDDGALNRELRVLGWRGGSLVSLVEPGKVIRYGEIVTWMAGGSDLEVKVYREESAAWQCLGEQAVTWRWSANFFRPVPDADGYFFQNTANCLFYGAEPLYAQPIDEARATIGDILPFVTSEDDYAAQRTQVIQAMLAVFDGDVGSALALALDLDSRAEPGSWLAQQTGAFISALNETDVKPLAVCASLIEASPHGACNIDDALARLFDEQPLVRDRPIDEQLLELGITVQNQQTVSTVGRADRQVVRFNLAGEHWWAFAPLDPLVYTAEKADP
ncbi:MAG: hypothetical protein K8J31_16555, partial [Anaerolineae bacterium]|nr:hypothetical protein [Anaerolineae bacterium]